MSKKILAAAALAAALLSPSVGSTAPSVDKVARGQTHERACLVAAAWNEARGRPDTEMAAVMHVVVNRVEHPAFAKSVCGVVLEKGQFQMDRRFRDAVERARRTGRFIVSGLRDADRAILDRLDALATIVLDGNSVDPTKGATHFWSPKLRREMGYASGPAWARKLPMTLSLGPFRFHKLKA